MQMLSINRKRVMRLAGTAIVAIFVALLGLNFFVSWTYTSWLVSVPCSGRYLSIPDVESEAIIFDSRDGFEIRGWFIPGSTYSDTVIMVQPGYGGNTEAAIPDAQVLYETGYSILLFEHRSCATAEVQSGLGIYEAQDVLGAVDFLASRDDITRIGGLGFSAGGTAMMLAAAEDERIEAVVIQGVLDDLRRGVLGDPPPSNIFERIYRQTVFWFIQARLDLADADMRPEASIGEISPRPVLIVFGEFESAFSAESLLNEAGEPKELWTVPGAGHGGYIYAAPDEYPNRMAEFFLEAFSDA